MCKKTFEHLDALLRRVSEDLTGALDWPPPPQEKECIAVATLNLLRLQVGNKNYVVIMERTKHSVVKCSYFLTQLLSLVVWGGLRS